MTLFSTSGINYSLADALPTDTVKLIIQTLQTINFILQSDLQI